MSIHAPSESTENADPITAEWVEFSRIQLEELGLPEGTPDEIVVVAELAELNPNLRKELGLEEGATLEQIHEAIEKEVALQGLLEEIRAVLGDYEFENAVHEPGIMEKGSTDKPELAEALGR